MEAGRGDFKRRAQQSRRPASQPRNRFSVSRRVWPIGLVRSRHFADLKIRKDNSDNGSKMAALSLSVSDKARLVAPERSHLRHAANARSVLSLGNRFFWRPRQIRCGGLMGEVALGA